MHTTLAAIGMGCAGIAAGALAGRFLSRSRELFSRHAAWISGGLGVAAWCACMYWGMGAGMASAAYVFLFCFMALCDRACRRPRQRFIFLVLCVVLTGVSVLDACGRVQVVRFLGQAPGKERDGIVLQQTDYSCLPASAATCLRHFDVEKTETQLADEAGTSWDGTRLPRMARVLNGYLQGMGWRAVWEKRGWSTLPSDGTPAILNIDWCGIRHAVVFLGLQKDRALLGNPLSGRERWRRGELEADWSGDGIFFERE